MRLPQVRPRNLTRAIQKEGFLIKRRTGGHLYFHHPDCRTTSISIHPQPIPKGTLKAILNQTKITLEKLRELLK